ncbi:MAG: acetate--CoA ligase family protein [Azospirillaceae bacterium]|nr:acetate--CoA ligase family protein [Azospirillaceae bacterium]
MLSSFFHPSSVAVVGASDDVGKLRGKLLKLLKASGHRGAVHPVHPKGGTIQGQAAWPDLASIPGGVELVLVATPGESVPGIIAQAVDAGAKAAVILSSGVDKAALDAAVGDSGLRYMGPNTEGYYITSGVAATFAAVVEEALAAGAQPPRPGRPISIVSQSGGLGFALYGRALAEHLDVRAVITTGNEGDLECLDAVDHLLDEQQDAAILLFIEGLKDPQRFLVTAARAADAGVPLVVMKIGRSEAGQRAAISHTAHLTGADTAYDAVFERHGVLRVLDQEEMLAAAAAFSRMPRGRVQRVAVVTTSGGAGAWAADLCGSVGIDVPLLSPALQADISTHIPAFGSAANPVDVTAQAVEDGGATLVKVLAKLQASDEVDAVIVNIGLAKTGRIHALANVLRPLFAAAAKPILFHSHILPGEENLAALAALGGQGFRSFRACALALQALDRHAVFQERWRSRSPAAPVGAAVLGPVRGVLGEADTRHLLEAYRIPVPPTALATSRDEALAVAQALGAPVVLKIQSPDIAHKTEAGGVALNVGLDAVAATFDRVVAASKSHAPDARIEGVLVQKMMAKGHELVIGVTRDPDFGPLLMLGSGGIYLEVLKDVVFAPSPITPKEAMALIGRLKTAPILHGVRGQEPADLQALADLVSRVADLARTETSLDQLDLNPVFVYGRGQGVVAVDALAVAAEPETGDHQ